LHFPVEITIGHLSILVHSITEVLGYFVGFRYFLYLRKKQGDSITSSNRSWILLGAAFGAFLGSHVIGSLENPPQLRLASNVFLYFYQNKTVLGGFLGGLAGVELVKKIVHEKHASGDLFTYPIILALIIGRIGCFSMGIHEATYGLPTALPWGMHLGDNELRHPVCLYEIIFISALWIMLAQLHKRYTLRSGAYFKIFMITYCLFRFVLDFVKPHYIVVFGLSTIQLTAFAGFLYYYGYIIRPKKLLVPSAEYNFANERQNLSL
jgi:phosphatidylglycerol:prolipoprotein diacylglycerol transferase